MMKASHSSIELLYTTPIEKADSLTEWGLFLFYGAAIYNSYREGRLSDLPLLSIQLLYTTHRGEADTLIECRPLSFLYSFYVQLM